MTSKRTWHRHDVLGRVLVILRNSEDPEHRDSYLFLSSYQLAILLDENHPEIRQELDMPIAGPLEPGEPNRGSLAQYLAGRLSSLLSNRHRDERINHIERAFLSGTHLNNVSFSSDEGVLEAIRGRLSMFRYRP